MHHQIRIIIWFLFEFPTQTPTELIGMNEREFIFNTKMKNKGQPKQRNLFGYFFYHENETIGSISMQQGGQGGPTKWAKGGRVGKVNVGLRDYKTIACLQDGPPYLQLPACRTSKEQKMHPKKLHTEKAALIALLNTISPCLPESHMYLSLSNLANIFSSIKMNQNVGADPLIVTFVGWQDLIRMLLELGGKRNQGYQRVGHHDSRRALVTGAPKLTAFCLPTQHAHQAVLDNH